MLRKCLGAALLLLIAANSAAQDINDPSSQARFRLGPLALSPSIALTNLGIDNNVFDEPNSGSPKSDFTFTLQARLESWLHLRRALLNGTVTDDAVYFRRYANQRFSNTSYQTGLVVPLTRLTFKGNAGYTKAKDRPGFEIDTRLLHTQSSFDGAVEWRASSKLFFGVRTERQRVDFDEAASFAGASLRNELSRTSTGNAVTIRQKLTPLTTLDLEVSREHDRFKFNALRDSNSTKVVVGALFDQFALLKGTARIGYRAFTPLVSGLPDYRGAVASIDLSYVARGATKINLALDRDINYSYDVNQPYYLQTGGILSVSQQVAHAVDVVGRAGLQRLSYRDRAGAVLAAASRIDSVRMYEAGIGYRLGRTARIGFNVDKQHRASVLTARTYDRTSFFVAVNYGF